MTTDQIERGPGRPRKGYRLESGKRVPSVTTITGRFKDSGGLIHWAWKQGADGIPLDEARNKAADIGSCVHDAVEAFLHDGPPAPHLGRAPDPVKAHAAFDAFREWWGDAQLQILATEVPLVSEEHGFGGTLDAMAVDRKGRLVVLDWKTSNAVYIDMIVQLAAYARLWRECRGGDVNAAHLCRFSKAGSFHHHYYPDLAPGWEYFRALRSAYDLQADLKAML